MEKEQRSRTQNTGRGPEEENASVRPSFREAFRRAVNQTELYLASDEERDALRELCYLIAEIYVIADTSPVRIGEELLDGPLVREVFEELTIEHLRFVRGNFLKQPTMIRNKRAYLRTSLYHAVFELEAHYENVASLAMKGEKR